MEPLSITLEEWLLAQCHREDEVGTIARAWAETAGDMEQRKPFPEWWSQRKVGLVLTSAVAQSEAEYSEALFEFRDERSPATFPSRWASKEFKARCERQGRFHEANAGLSGSTYLRMLHCELEDELRSRKIVYLDTSYWVKMRDSLLGRGESHFDLLVDRLTSLVSSGRIICPLSYNLFEELMRQRDIVTREVTARLMDVLSIGVCLQTPDQLIDIEIRRQIYRAIKPEFPEAWKEWIWTKVGFLLGEELPNNDNLPVEANNYVQKVFIDHMWSESKLVEILGHLGEAEFPLPDNEKFAAATNIDFLHIRRSGFKWKDVREQEFGLVWHRYYAENFARIAKEFWNSEQQACLDYMDKDDCHIEPNPNVLPNFQILANLSAYFASDHKKVIRPTDISDLEHAAFGLPYCDVYTSDRRMAHAIRQRPHRFDQAYGTTVCGKVEELLEALEDL